MCAAGRASSSSLTPPPSRCARAHGATAHARPLAAHTERPRTRAPNRCAHKTGTHTERPRTRNGRGGGSCAFVRVAHQHPESTRSSVRERGCVRRRARRWPCGGAAFLPFLCCAAFPARHAREGHKSAWPARMVGTTLTTAARASRKARLLRNPTVTAEYMRVWKLQRSRFAEAQPLSMQSHKQSKMEFFLEGFRPFAVQLQHPVQFQSDSSN